MILIFPICIKKDKHRRTKSSVRERHKAAGFRHHDRIRPGSRSYLHYEFPDQKLSDLIGNQPLDSDVCSRHEFPDLIFSKLYGKFDTVKVSRSRYSTRYDSLKDIKTVFWELFFLRCKYLVKQFPACCFILKNGNS